MQSQIKIYVAVRLLEIFISATMFYENAGKIVTD